jgi:hypothetical protein
MEDWVRPEWRFLRSRGSIQARISDAETRVVRLENGSGNRQSVRPCFPKFRGSYASADSCRCSRSVCFKSRRKSRAGWSVPAAAREVNRNRRRNSR